MVDKVLADHYCRHTGKRRKRERGGMRDETGRDEREKGVGGRGGMRERVKANKNIMKSYFVPLGVHLLICRCLSLKA